MVRAPELIAWELELPIILQSNHVDMLYSNSLDLLT